MAIPTVEQVAADVQAFLGDDPTLLVYTQVKQQPFFGVAYRELWDLMMAWNLQTVALEQVVSLTGSMDSVPPSGMSISHMGEPTRLWERTPLSGEDWQIMDPVTDLPQRPGDAKLHVWKWENDRFRFIQPTGDRELKVEYLSSGAPPTTGDIPIDDSRSFLALRTASLMALPYGMPGLAQTYKLEALGPSGEPDGTGGALRKLVYPMLKQKQNIPVVPPRFRARRWHP